MLRFRDVRRTVAVQTIEALAGLCAGPACLEALAVLLLAAGVFARAASFLGRHSLLPLLLLFADVIVCLTVLAADTAASQGVAWQSVFQTVTVSLRAAVLMAVAKDLAFYDWCTVLARLRETHVLSHK